MSQLVTVLAEMHAKPGKEEELRRELLAMVEATRKEDGCVQYDLHVSTAGPGHFFFYENWTSADHLARHSASPHLTAFGKIAGDLLSEPVRVATFTRVA
jgi:quinol monooxygenase YgiN